MCKKLISISLIITVVLVGFGNAALACTSVFAGKDATKDGSTLIARNEDMDSAWTKKFEVFPRTEYKKEDVEVFYNGLEVPRPEIGLKYFALPDWDPSYGPYKEAGINEKGVAITATNSAYMNDKAKEADPLVDEGIGETHIPSLILPRATSAKEGVKILGEMIEKYGAMEANGLAISDKDEVWYIEIGSGHHWVAVRVPDDKYVVVANQLRIDNIDKYEDVLMSEGLRDFVYENGLLKEDEELDFAKAFGKLGEKYNTRREWGAQKLLSPSINQKATKERYPLFLKPDEKLSEKDVMEVLRYKYQGTKYDPELPNVEGERTIGVDRTMESHIIQMRQDMPVELSGVMWLAVGNPEYSTYVPFYAGMTETPDSYKKGTDTYDSESAYWSFRGAAALAQTNEAIYGKSVKEFWNNYENQMIEELKVTDKMLLDLYKKDKEQALKMINRISNRRGLEAVEKAKKLRRDILTNIARKNSDVYNPDL